MKQEDLIKKLENMKTPDIEIQSHKQRLKLALLSSGYFKEKPIMFWTKRLVPAGVALALILVVGFGVIQPKLQIARAMEIAKNDPQIQKVMEETGAVIKEVKIKDGRAYVLLAMPEEELPSIIKETGRLLKGIGERTGERKLGIGEEGIEVAPVPMQIGIVSVDEKGEVKTFTGTVVEINLKARRVEKLELVEKMKIDITPLTAEEKARAIEIAKSDPKIQEMINLEEAQVAVKPMPSFKLRLEENPDDGMKAISADPNEDKRANVIFRWGNGRQDIITVNLTTGKVEGAMGFGRMPAESIHKPMLEFPEPITPKLLIIEKKLVKIAEQDSRVQELTKGMKSKFKLHWEKENTLVLRGTIDGKDYEITIDLENEKVESVQELEPGVIHPIEEHTLLYRPETWGQKPPEEKPYGIIFSSESGSKTLEELLESAELISENEEEGLKTYCLPDGKILEVIRKDGLQSVKIMDKIEE
jgi:hypothetical protein